jgi:hypothetical protein
LDEASTLKLEEKESVCPDHVSKGQITQANK